MIEFKDMTDMSVEVSFPKEFKLNLGTEILKMPLEKIKTDSFNSVEIPFGRLINDIFTDISIASLRGKNGTFQLKRKSLMMILFLKGGMTRASLNKKEQKLISDKELESLSVDTNYLYGSILGTLGLLSEKMRIEISSNFKKEGIFNDNFNSKVKEDFLKNNGVEEVWGLSFKRQEEVNNVSTEFIYEFEHNDIDEVRMIERKDKTFSPFNLSLIIDRTLKDLNKMLSGW